MTTKLLVQTFGGLDAKDQAKHMAAWIHAATIDARDTYIPGVEGIADPVRLRRFNELQHRLAGELRDLLGGEKAKDGFVAAVFEEARELHASALRSAMERAGAVPGRKQRRAG